MEHYAGLDVSLELTSVCIVDAQGGIVCEAKVASEPEALIRLNAILETVIGSMLAARAALESEFKHLHRALLGLVGADPVCRQLMSVPGVGAIVAITFKSGVDDPMRFRRSRDVGPHFGLTPRKYQSGELDVTGSISKVGDRMVRTALYEAASVMLTRTVRFSALKAWAMAVARRRGTKKARVALARKLAVILHRMWVDGTSFRWANEETAIA